MLIQNYGLFWQRDSVDWGRPGSGNAGTLMGKPASKRRADPVNFRYQRGVYALYDDRFKIVYVGQAGRSENDRLFSRLKRHKSDHLAQRWTRFSWFGLLPVKNRDVDDSFEPRLPATQDVLDHIEAILLATTEPPLNLQRGRFGKKVLQYIQWADSAEYDDEDVEDTEDEEE